MEIPPGVNFQIKTTSVQNGQNLLWEFSPCQPHLRRASPLHDGHTGGSISRFPVKDCQFAPLILDNLLPLELERYATTHFEGFVELSSFPSFSRRFVPDKVV